MKDFAYPVRTFIFAVLLTLLASVNTHLQACTNFLVSRGASVDGCTMISYAADSHIRYGELYFRPRGVWSEGSMITLYDRGTAKPLGQIPQPRVTYQVIGFMNEYQLSIGETTFDGRLDLQDTTAIVDYGSLMFLALQRARTAREAIAVMADLVERYGYASTGESLSIADPDEVWIMEIIGKGVDMQQPANGGPAVNANRGAVWVARRVPEGYICAHANQARITTFPLADGRTSITSKQLERLSNPEVATVYAHDVVEFARKKGYYNGPDAAFSFSDVYAPLTFGAMRFSEMRVWTFFNHAGADVASYWDYAKGLDSTRRMPLWVKPAHKLSVRDLMAAKRDYLQGTELDMSQDVGAGPFGLPYRWRPLTWEYDGKQYFNERATATQQTGFSFVAQMRGWLPNAIGGVFWFGVDDVNTTLYMPFYCGISSVPPALAEGNGDMLTYSPTAAFWIFNRVAHFAYLFYSRVYPEIRAVQQQLEEKYYTYQPAIDQGALALWKIDSAKAIDFLTEYSLQTAQQAVDRWDKLGNFLLVKYLDGNVKQEADGVFLRNPWGYPRPPKFPGYPDAWKREVIRETGDRFLMR